MRALIAARLSRKQKGGKEGIGLDTQDSRSREFCDRMGWTVAGVARDTISGAKAPIDRKDLGRWITDPTLRASYDVIVAYKSDRLSRGEDTDWSRIETWAADNGKVLCVVDSMTGIRYPARDDSDYWQWSAMKRQAGRELNDIKERIDRALGGIKDNGGLIGRNPFGYDIAGDKYSKTLVINQAEAAIITEAADAYLAGNTLDAICESLNAAGKLPRSGANWSAKTLSQMFRNETIAGRHKQGNVTLKVTPILKRDKWEKVIARIDARATRKGISQTDTPALLTSIIQCGNGHNMYRIQGKYYYCRHGCKTMIPITEADNFMKQWLAAHTLDKPDTVIKVIPSSGHQDAIDEVKRDMTECIASEDFGRLGSLQSELERLRNLPADPAKIIEVETGRSVWEAWKERDANGQRQYLMDHGYWFKAIERHLYVVGNNPVAA